MESLSLSLSRITFDTDMGNGVSLSLSLPLSLSLSSKGHHKLILPFLGQHIVINSNPKDCDCHLTCYCAAKSANEP